MNYKVLLADDSLTIQKVIKITLANQPYDVVDCSSEDELLKKIPEVKPRIVFLDFNLSEKYTGYELTSKIRSLSPKTKVLLLLGTFDTVDENLMEKCGASDKVVKPFDSNKFIAICKRLIDEDEDFEVDLPKVDQDKTQEHDLTGLEEDQWQMSHSNLAEETEVEETPSEVIKMNVLTKEISDWGMEVPGIIGSVVKVSPELPPVISEDPIEPQELTTPKPAELEYPTIEQIQASMTSKLVPIETLNIEESFEIEHSINSNDETDIAKLQEQIKDEVETNLWKIDEFEEKSSFSSETTKPNFQPSINDFDESLFKPLDDTDSIKWTVSDDITSVSKSAPVVSTDGYSIKGKSEVEDLVKKYVKEYLDEMFRKEVEKISWDIIPDLAENLIRQELSKISNKIISDLK